MSFNKIIVVGNLGRDPELRYTPQGTPVCSFSIASNERRKDRTGELQDVTTWFRVTLWGRQAENASTYLSKGRKVYVEGRLRLEEYTDREGNKRSSLEINGSDLQFLERADAAGQQTDARAANSSSVSGGQEPKNDEGIKDDDIPF